MARIVVVGAGVVGLTTAVNIQNLLPSAKVTIVADKFYKDTTSFGAGGLFRPTFQHMKGDKNLLRKWSQCSWDFFSSKAVSGESKEVGAYLLDGYMLSSKKEIDPLLNSVAFNVRLLSEKEKREKGFQSPYVQLISTLGITPAVFLDYLMRRFRSNGGIVFFHTVKSLEEFVGKYDIVVNCSALGSQQLVNDESVFPVRGQLRRVRAPWVKHWYMDENNTYLVPQSNGDLVLGGCRQRGNYDTSPDKALFEDISERCEKLVPGIKGAEVVSDWVGLRPTREPVRIEKELMDFNGTKLRVVHNYGHGANGISMSWGTAVDAAQLVRDWAMQLPLSSRL